MIDIEYFILTPYYVTFVPEDTLGIFQRQQNPNSSALKNIRIAADFQDFRWYNSPTSSGKLSVKITNKNIYRKLQG